MSRIIIKNLPSGTKEDKLKSTFGEVGQITDCSLKFTREGIFRKFAFIGFKSESEADAAVKRFNKSFINTSKLQVEIAKDLADSDKPRAWSRHTPGTTAYMEDAELKAAKTKSKSKHAKKETRPSKSEHAVQENKYELLGELKDDPGFEEFVVAHKNRASKAAWGNDIEVPGEAKDKGQGTSRTSQKEDVDESDDEDHSEKDSQVEDNEKVSTTENISDIDYIKSKMTKNKFLTDDDDDDDDVEDDDVEENKEDKKVGKKKGTKKKEKTVGKKEKSSGIEEGETFHYMVNMRGLPGTATQKQILEFFKPIKPKQVKVPRRNKGTAPATTVATVQFSTEKDWEMAMRRNKNFIGAKKIYLHKVKTKADSAKEEKPRPWETKNSSEKGRTDDGEEEDETIAESGRLFARNLPYCCTETELEELFGKYGQLTEVHLPIDSFTRKIKGFAFITFMMPEHAVKAYTALDGSTFQGRMLHLLPGKAKKEEDVSETTDEHSYKKKKEAKLKATAGSSHNWNTLFLGANAVADVMAERYGASKSDILNAEGKQSVGVRLALGETQVVAETRDFLIDNGVALDAFSQAAAARSKTVILVKNLPASTSEEDIRTMFERFGHLGRVVLPPSGITAIVEFLEPSEARSGFRGLAYTKFKYAPLYLEWAPVDVFRAPTPAPSTGAEDAEMKEEITEESSKKQVVAKDSSSSESEDEETEPGSTLFIKNLNFDTTQDKLTQIFSKCGKLRAVSISKKKDMKNPGSFLSLGYGFVEYTTATAAKQALKELQHASIDGHQVELKVSNRATIQPPAPRQKQDTKKKQTSTKILIRNIPFEAALKEIRELFGVFGEIKSLRIPKKMSGTGSHRGFGFVDFLTKQDAKRAFNALCHSTHLYGRRLVLEWADSADTVEQLRRKTADHFHDGGPSKRLKKSTILEQLNPSRELT